jgi:hypothetical protein
LKCPCFEIGHSIGRKAIVDLGIIESLAVLFNDPEKLARKNSHLTIEMTSEAPFGKLL